MTLLDRLLTHLVDWLTVPLYPTTDDHLAATSPWQYGQATPDGPWTTSRLGILNGYLPRFGGWYLVRYVDEDTHRPVRPYLGFLGVGRPRG